MKRLALIAAVLGLFAAGRARRRLRGRRHLPERPAGGAR